jgi:hypothetical protein
MKNKTLSLTLAGLLVVIFLVGCVASSPPSSTGNVVGGVARTVTVQEPEPTFPVSTGTVGGRLSASQLEERMGSLPPNQVVNLFTGNDSFSSPAAEKVYNEIMSKGK